MKTKIQINICKSAYLSHFANLIVWVSVSRQPRATYLYLYLSKYTYIYMYMCIYKYVNRFTSPISPISSSGSPYPASRALYIHSYLYLSLSLSIYIHIHIYIDISIYIDGSRSVPLPSLQCRHPGLHILPAARALYIYIYTYIYIYIYISIYPYFSHLSHLVVWIPVSRQPRCIYMYICIYVYMYIYIDGYIKKKIQINKYISLPLPSLR